MWVQSGCRLWLCLPDVWRVHWWQVAGCRGFRCPAVCVPSLSPCLLSFLSLCLWWVACKYGSISHFKGVFSVVCGACVGLFVLGVLRGLCGFCVREWLGGLKARCVFASVFILLCSCFYLVSSFLGLSSCPLLVLSLCGLLLGFFLGCCFFFPYGLYAKKKGRKVLLLASSLRGLWVFRFLYSC